MTRLLASPDATATPGPLPPPDPDVATPRAGAAPSPPMVASAGIAAPGFPAIPGTAPAGHGAGGRSPVPALATPSVPAPGTYVYRYSTDGVAREGALEVVDAGGGRQVHTQAAGQGEQRQTVRWEGSARALVTSTSPDGDSCAWSPALVTLRWPLAVGARWNATGSCTIEDQDGSVVIERAEEAEVAGTLQWRLDDGTEVGVWLIRRHAEVTHVFEGTRATSEAAVSELFAPALGLPVYLTSRTVTPTRAGPPASTTTSAALVSDPGG